ncbi:uncharacterized protein LOC135841039 [Planococcus citri]|uniref:uncharacterized protein LOC135841039 n=1 Tax=Planococcus citri TaxID=170843 RepID=UPI0031F8250B
MSSENSTNATFSIEVTLQTCTFEKVISALQNIGYLVSFIYLLRVYYYFWIRGVYTLQKKNLLSLCINLSALYSLIIVDMIIKIPNFLIIISCCEVTTTILLFIMSMDTCVNLRRRARNLPIDDGSECKLFLFYTFCSWIVSQSVAYTLAYLYDNFLIILIDFHLISYTLILIMFFISLYNIKPATVNLGSSSRNFSIFGRTLIITFVTSSIKFAFAIIFYATGKQIDLLLFLDCLMAYDGIFIYYCLTFKNKKLPNRLPATPQIHVISNNHAVMQNDNVNRNRTLSNSNNSANNNNFRFQNNHQNGNAVQRNSS